MGRKFRNQFKITAPYRSWLLYDLQIFVFKTWCKLHKLWNDLKRTLHEPTVKIGTLAGAIHAVREGAGIAIMPTHCVASELKAGEVFEYRLELVIEMLRSAKAILG